MTWNLWWRFGPDWRARQPAILSTLESAAPDVVGLQEVWADDTGSQATDLADALGMHAAFAAPSYPPPPDAAGVELGVAMLSRWPISRVRRHPLPTNDGTGPVTLLATLDHPAGPLHAAVSCVDPGEAHAPRRAAQTRSVAALLTDQRLDGPLPVLLAADLNAAPRAPELRALTGSMVDTWAVAPGEPDGDGATLSAGNPFAEPGSYLIDKRIDYVLARPGRPDRPVTVAGAEVTGYPVAGVYPSDHYAVVADILV